MHLLKRVKTFPCLIWIMRQGNVSVNGPKCVKEKSDAICRPSFLSQGFQCQESAPSSMQQRAACGEI
jgi:hypothetical protein